MWNIKAKLLSLAILATLTETASGGNAIMDRNSVRSVASSRLNKVQGNLLPIRSGTKRPPKPVLPYVQVAPSGNYCKKKGASGNPRRCTKYLPFNSDTSSCQAWCDTFVGCIGYSYRLYDERCNLFTREDRCPNPLIYKNGPVIMGVNQFEGTPGDFTGCYAKTCLAIGGECITGVTLWPH